MKHVQQFLSTCQTVATNRAYTERLTRFDRWLGRRRPTKQLCRQYITSMIGLGLSNQTIKLHHQTLRRYFNWLIDEHGATASPMGKIRLDVPTSQRRGFTSGEVERLLLHARGEWRAMIVIGYETGLRLGDIATLSRDELDLDRRLIALVPNKTRRFAKRVSIPLSKRVTDLLQPLRPQLVAASHLFPHAAVHYQTDGSQSLSAQFHALARRAGVRNGGFHMLRHSFVERCVAANAHPLVICALTGHSLGEVQRYSRPSEELKRQVISKF